MSRDDLSSLASVAVLAVLLVVIAFAWYANGNVILAISLGALGGLVHELAQSHGRIFSPGKQDDKAFYFGSLGGVFVGAIAGILAIQSILTTVPPVETARGVGSAFAYTLAFTAFVAGLGLKGVAEAITTEDAGTPSVTEVSPPSQGTPSLRRTLEDILSKTPVIPPEPPKVSQRLRNALEELLGPALPPRPRI